MPMPICTSMLFIIWHNLLLEALLGTNPVDLEVSHHGIPTQVVNVLATTGYRFYRYSQGALKKIKYYIFKTA